MNRVYILALVSCSIAASASAQPYAGTALFRWEGSADGGATWVPGELIVPPEQESVLVRARVSWSGPARRFHDTAFDIAIVGDGGSGDTADSFAFHPRLSTTPLERVAAMRFGNVLKIDDGRDTLPPGEGHVALRMLAEDQFGIPPLDDPIELFRFKLVLDGAPGPRVVNEHFFALTHRWPDMNTTDRVLVLSVDAGGPGGYILPLTTREALNIRVLPAPGGLALLAFAALAAARRRRQE